MNERFKIQLINISLRPKSEKLFFPIGFAYIATAISYAGFESEILDLDVLRLSDEELEMQIKNAKFNVVAMGCIVTGYKYIKKICGVYANVSADETIRSKFASNERFLLFLQSKKISAP